MTAAAPYAAAIRSWPARRWFAAAAISVGAAFVTGIPTGTQCAWTSWASAW